MAVSTKCGQFTLNTGTGSQAVTGLGFQPKLMIFFTNDMTADGLGNNACMGFGYATTSNAYSVSSFSANGIAESADARHGYWPAAFSLVSALTTKLRCSLTSLDSDGFTINVDVTDGVARKVNYIALGGADFSAYVGNNTSPTATGSQTLSGFGITPEAMIFNQSRVSGAGGGTLNRGGFNIGITDASTQYFLAVESDDGGLVTDSRRQVGADAVLAFVDTGGNVELKGARTSLDVGGATMNWLTVLGTAYQYGYAAVTGAEWKVGRFTSNTATGTQSITGLGFRPKMVLCFSRNNVHDTTSYTHLIAMIGASDGTNEYSIWMGDEDNQVDTSDTDQSLSSTKFISTRTQSTGAVRWEADLQSMDSGGFTLDWTTVQGSGEEFYYLAFGEVDPVTPSLLPRLTMMGAG